MEQGLIEVVGNKKDIKRLLDLLNESGLDEVELSVVTLEQVDDFIAGTRKNLAFFEINGENLLEVKSTKDSAQLLKRMLTEVNVDHLLFPALSKSNVSDFLSGIRTNVLQLDVILADEEVKKSAS